MPTNPAWSMQRQCCAPRPLSFWPEATGFRGKLGGSGRLQMKSMLLWIHRPGMLVRKLSRSAYPMVPMEIVKNSSILLPFPCIALTLFVSSHTASLPVGQDDTNPNDAQNTLGQQGYSDRKALREPLDLGTNAGPIIRALPARKPLRLREGAQKRIALAYVI
jgi:hypothetical protein